MEQIPDVIVVGAGLAGLSAAATAARTGARVVLVDGRPPGGRARTDKRNGFSFNQGAHALYVGGAAGRVLRRLAVPMPSGGPPAVDDSWGLRSDGLVLLPGTPRTAVASKAMSGRAKLRLGAASIRLFRTPAERLADRSFEEWLDDQRLPDDAAAIVRAGVRTATYCGDLSSISADAAVLQFRLGLRSGVRYLHRGWQVLVDALVDRYADSGGLLKTGVGAVAIEAQHGRPVVVTGDDAELPSRSVVVAGLSPDACSQLITGAVDFGPGVGSPVTAACLDLGTTKPATPKVILGLEDPVYLSTHTPPADLAPAGFHVVHALRYGARSAATDRADLSALAQRAGIGEDDIVEQRFLARMVVANGTPTPGHGLTGRPGIDAAGVPNVFLAGDWIGDEGMLADAAMASGEAAGRAAAHHALAAMTP